MATSGIRKLKEPAHGYLADFDSNTFPRAALYQALRQDIADGTVRESLPRRKAYPYTERHLHCVWFDPDLRPATLRARTGETITVDNPGTWNQEAGPDFLGAVLSIGPDKRRMAGDVEIHVHPSDWRAHGHSADPRYRNVRFHVTYFPGAEKDIGEAPGAVHIVLKEALTANPGFSFEHIDLAAYPYAARADMPPCSEALRACAPDMRMAVLRAAGEERLRRKSERLALLIQEKGAEQALYEECMAGLGYKHNKSAFRHVAQTLPTDTLRRASRHDPHAAYALLMGVAGLLPEQPSPRWDPETNQFMRSLWDVWWRYRDQYMQHRTPSGWRLDGIRPANHPARRLMAAAHLFSARASLAEQIRRNAVRYPNQWIKQLMTQLTTLQDPYVSMRLGFNRPRRATPTALIGPARAASLITNVVIPFLVATGETTPEPTATALDQLPVEPDNGIIKQTAFYLLGRDHAPALYKTELARQGLIQIFQDFCLNDRSRCANCPFPRALRAHATPPSDL